tara:strand:- start:446 stop:721 length:276 start_codon:yes stop_codon:yes gene_type:complete
MQIYTPEGHVGEPQTNLAPSPVVLSGKRIGVLDNTKPNAGILLNRLATRLEERTKAILVTVETKNAALAAPDQVMGKLTKEVEIVLTGSAD